MGQDQSKQNPSVAHSQTPQVQKIPEKIIAEEYEGIPIISPIVYKDGPTEKYPPDIILPAGELPQINSMVKTYFHDISFHINKNEEAISSTIKKQLEEYNEMPKRIEFKRRELDKRLAVFSNLFKQLDASIQSTTDALNAAIKKADELAAELDPNMPKFSSQK